MNPFTESTVARPISDLSTDPTSFTSPVSSPPVSCPLMDANVGVDTAARHIASKAKLGLNAAHRFKGPRMPFVRSVSSMAWGLGLAACIVLAAPGRVYAVDVNAATQAQLEAVRGIGPKTAQIIIEERMRGGKYESFDDLSDRVKGIGPKKAASLQAAGLTVAKGTVASVNGAPLLKQPQTGATRAAK